MLRAFVRPMYVLVLLAALASPAAAEQAWVKDEVRLNLRTGAGSEFRIIGAVTTGDSLEVLANEDSWTRVRAGTLEGWIPAGFLQAEPPAKIALERIQTEAEELRQRVKALTTETESLRAENASLHTGESERTAEIDRLTRENMELSAGERWPEWITGASILSVGGLIGILVHAMSSRRTARRIRL
jgi:SH3 domain protein